MFLKSLFRYLLLVLLFLNTSLVFSQEGSRSAEQTVINGKKYYLHTVAKGQTLYALSKLYNVTIDAIVAENPELSEGLKKGVVVRIPQVTLELPQSADEKGKHKVKSGETYYSIAKQYGVSVEQIKKWNPSISDGLKVNDIIRIADMGREKPTLEKTTTGQTLTSGGGAISRVAAKDSDAVTQRPPSKKIAISLLLPFHSAEYDESDREKYLSGIQDLNSRSELAIQYLQGVRLAADSLSQRGLSVQLHVYDIDEGDSTQIAKLLKLPLLAKSDLIIGPFFGNVFGLFADFAAKHHIPIVSPLIAQNRILFNNPWVVKPTPSNLAQVEALSKYINQKYSQANVLVVNSALSKDVPLVKAALVGLGSKVGAKDSAREAKGFTGLSVLLQSDNPNIVFIPSTNQSFVTEMLTRLHPLREKYAITVFGMANWTEFENIDVEYFNNLKVHLPSLNFTDFESHKVKHLRDDYETQYSAEPSTIYFQAYDLLNYLAPLIAQYGSECLKKMPGHPYNGLQLGFDFFQINAENGFENKCVHLLEYKDYKIGSILR